MIGAWIDPDTDWVYEFHPNGYFQELNHKGRIELQGNWLMVDDGRLWIQNNQERWVFTYRIEGSSSHVYDGYYEESYILNRIR
tara:strand:+ start:109 stop:357 length:249 start_codon:yes stop_codon:yes gene_type:complete